MMSRWTRAACLAPLLVACSGLPPGVPRSYRPEQVPQAIVELDQELATGDYEVALARARIANATRNLAPEVRNAAQTRLETAALARIEQLVEEGKRPKKLEKIFDLALPRQLSSLAGIEAAKLYYAKRKRMKAYRMVREVDSKYPQHQQRARGASLLYDIGTDLADDDGHRFLWFFPFRDLAPVVFEYLVLNHPEERRGDIVYRRLADLYEEEERWRLAIERNEDLILWHPRSPLIPGARARIPNLRLQFLKSPEYDRSELVLARDELDTWLQDFAELAEEKPEMFEQVQIDRIDALQRLADSDMSIARFYIRVGNAFGAELHAQRAIEEASLGGDESQLEEARAVLVRVEQLVEQDRQRTREGATDILDALDVRELNLGGGDS